MEIMEKGRRLDVDDDVLLEILSRLPAKTLGRFKLVCRGWEGLISDPYLLRAQARRSTGNVLGLLTLMSTPQGGKRLVCLPLNRDDVDEAPHTILDLPVPPERRILLQSACNGLLFFWLSYPERYLVVNPTTKSLRQIPALDISMIDAVFGLAFDPARTDFKVVACERRMQQGQRHMYKFFVYSPGAAAWRVSNATVLCTDRALTASATSVFFNGALHWLRNGGDLLAFDVEEERAYDVPLPQGVGSKDLRCFCTSMWLGVTAGCISLVDLLSSREVYVWVIEDYTSRRWELKHRILVEGNWSWTTVPKFHNTAPIFYDGDKCVFFTGISPRTPNRLAVYRVQSKQWDEIRPFICCRQFVPYISHMFS